MSTRTFVAIELDEAAREALARQQSALAAVLQGARWVDPRGIHLTLAFLGPLEDEELRQTISAAKAAARDARPFELRIGNVGFFGSPRAPRVVWAGVEDQTGRLAALHERLNTLLASYGFPVDSRPFAPHLTLARLNDRLSPDVLTRFQAMAREAPQALATMYVNALSVMKSELSREGARYTCLRAYTFGGEH